MFSDAGIGLAGSTEPIGDLIISDGKFEDMTVYDFLELAEKILGGDISDLASTCLRI